MSRGEIERILGDELEQASKRFRAASAQFRIVISDVPSGIPVPDGAFRVRAAADEKNAAARELQTALDRFNSFVLDGLVPEDLKNRLPKQ